ncbi:MAG: HupE/UreJ family protein [Sandaracinaceae bacterium]|nr:HupE/UreJ family protein [Sandaracinaceae bacterium]
MSRRARRLHAPGLPGRATDSATEPSRRGLALLALLALGLAAPAAAHLGSTKLVWVEPTDGGATVRVDLDPIDVAYELDVADPEHPDLDALLARADEVRAWAAGVFSMRTDGGACAVTPGEVGAVAVESLRFARAVRVELAFACPEPRASAVFRDEAVFPTDRQHEAIVRAGGAVTVLRVGRQEAPVGAAPSLGETLLTFLLEGAIHLFTGYDHVLFLLSLLLVAGELAARDGKKKAIVDVALLVTAFTVGHSVTLIAAALDVVALPSRLVESAIAASIVAVAGWNLVRLEARVGLRWVAAAFGLVHGFGFSSVLRELLLPAGQRVVALLAFNVGIELGQLAIVLLVVPLLALAGEARWYRSAVIRGGSALIALIASWWLVERAFDL